MSRRNQGKVILTESISRFFGLIFSGIFAGFILSCLSIPILVHVFFPGGILTFGKLVFGWFKFVYLANVIKTAPHRLHLKKVWLAEWDALGLSSSMPWTWIGSGFLVITLLGAFAYVWLVRRIGRRAALGRGVRSGEMMLVSPQELNLQIAQSTRDKTSDHQYTKRDLFIGDERVRITSKTANLSWLVTGLPGSGKTNSIKPMIEQELSYGSKCLIVDPNGEFFSELGRPGDIILSLMDTRTAKWDFWCEGMDEIQLASGLIEVSHGMSAEQKFWQGGGRAILAAFLRYSKSLEDLWRFCNFSLEETRDYLMDQRDPIVKELGESRSSKMADSKVSIATRDIAMSLKYLGHHPRQREVKSGKNEETFSIRKWVLNDDDHRSVFLVARDADWEVTKPFITLWSHIATYALLEKPVNRNAPRFKFCVEEITSVGAIPSLPLIPDRGRKYAGSLLMGCQSPSQVAQIWGDKAAVNILNSLQNVIVFRLNDETAAATYSKAFSQREMEWDKVTHSLSERGGASVATEVVAKPIITTSEIMSLRDRHAFMKISEFNPTKVYFSYKSYPKVNPDSHAMSERHDKPWLSQTPFARYRSVRDQSRRPFLDRLMKTANHFLYIVHQTELPNRNEALVDAARRVLQALDGAAVLRERIDGEFYEIAASQGAPRQESGPPVFNITVTRDSTKVSIVVEVPLESNQQVSPGQAVAVKDSSEDGDILELFE